MRDKIDISCRLISLVLLVAAMPAGAQSTDKFMRYLDSAHAVAPLYANILITQGDQVLVEKSYGYSDYRHHMSLSSRNAFQIASISKQFTAYGIMLLKHRGLLHYDSLVKRYLPEFPYDSVSIRHLLTHSSGLPDFWRTIRPELDHTRVNGNQEALDYLIHHAPPLQFRPGTKYEYCDIGYDFLANIIEAVSGKSYEVFMQDGIFDKLNMKGTHAYMVTDIRKIHREGMAVGHVRGKKMHQFDYAHLQPENEFVFYLGGFYGDGSIVSTARDLAVWSRALDKCTLLPCEVQGEAFVPFGENGQVWEKSIIHGPQSTVKTEPGDVEKINYGFGWKISKNAQGEKIISHGGSHPGNQHIIYKILDRGVTLIYLSNLEGKQNQVIMNGLIDIL